MFSSRVKARVAAADAAEARTHARAEERALAAVNSLLPPAEVVLPQVAAAARAVVADAAAAMAAAKTVPVSVRTAASPVSAADGAVEAMKGVRTYDEGHEVDLSQLDAGTNALAGLVFDDDEPGTVLLVSLIQCSGATVS